MDNLELKSECTASQMAGVLSKLPQKRPFLFLDQITELSDRHIVANYTFREDEFYFKGHFPGDPIVPGVILVEAMAQAGLVALGIYLLEKERPEMKMRTLFSDCQVEFLGIVRPGDRVTVRGERIFWRMNKLKSNVEMRLENGSLAAAGVVSGLGVQTE